MQPVQGLRLTRKMLRGQQPQAPTLRGLRLMPRGLARWLGTAPSPHWNAQ
jgi:hypothetical protein